VTVLIDFTDQKIKKFAKKIKIVFIFEGDFRENWLQLRFKKLKFKSLF